MVKGNEGEGRRLCLWEMEKVGYLGISQVISSYVAFLNCRSGFFRVKWF